MEQMYSYVVMISILVWIIIHEKVLPLSKFTSRKLVHAGCGAGMMLLDSREFQCRLFVWGVSVGSLAMTWGLSPLPSFRFGTDRDWGITLYLLLVSAWYWAELPSVILAPLFFADPAGAVVGTWVTDKFPGRNRVWGHDKTVAGTVAVLVVTMLSITYPCTFLQRMAVGLAAAVAEGSVSGDLDNITLGLVVLCGWKSVA